MTTQSTDTPELRKAFCEEFMWMSDLDHEHMTMPEIMEEFDLELGQAKRLYGRAIDTDLAWAEADSWLSDRGYSEEVYGEMPPQD